MAASRSFSGRDPRRASSLLMQSACDFSSPRWSMQLCRETCERRVGGFIRSRASGKAPAPEGAANPEEGLGGRLVSHRSTLIECRTGVPLQELSRLAASAIRAYVKRDGAVER